MVTGVIESITKIVTIKKVKISSFRLLKLCTFITRLKYVLWLHIDFFGEEGGKMALLTVMVFLDILHGLSGNCSKIAQILFG